MVRAYVDDGNDRAWPNVLDVIISVGMGPLWYVGEKERERERVCVCSSKVQRQSVGRKCSDG